MKRITEASLLAALNERDLFNNPDLLGIAADEVDCGSICVFRHGNECVKSKRGRYCANDLAETLRALAALSRREGEIG